VTDPETKRKIIGREFIRVFEEPGPQASTAEADIEFLVQGTLYPDVVESGGGEGAATNQVAPQRRRLPDDLGRSRSIEPLRTLFKDEVRQVGIELGSPDAIDLASPLPRPPAWAFASSERSRASGSRSSAMRTRSRVRS